MKARAFTGFPLFAHDLPNAPQLLRHLLVGSDDRIERVGNLPFQPCPVLGELPLDVSLCVGLRQPDDAKGVPLDDQRPEICVIAPKNFTSAVRKTEMIADQERNNLRQDNSDSDKRSRQEQALDEALENTFPASDPVSVEQPTTSGRARRSSRPRERTMGPLLVTCPRTGKEISTGIETDEVSLKDLGKLLMRVQCERLDLHTPAGGLQALGKVTVTGPCVEARCDRLTLAWPTGQVALDGAVRLAFQNRGVVHEMRAESVAFRLNAAHQPVEISAGEVSHRDPARVR